MNKTHMTNDESATIAKIETHYVHIARSLDELKEIVSLRPGTPLRDSVSLLVIDQIKEQRGSCGVDMTAVAITAVSEHVREYHTKKRDSTAPERVREANRSWPEIRNALGLFLLRYALPLIVGGGITATGLQILDNSNATQPAARVAPVDK